MSLTPYEISLYASSTGCYRMIEKSLSLLLRLESNLLAKRGDRCFYKSFSIKELVPKFYLDCTEIQWVFGNFESHKAFARSMGTQKPSQIVLDLLNM